MLHIEKEVFTLENDVLIVKEWEATYGIRAIFSTRHGGVSQAPYDTMNLSYTVEDNQDHVLQNRHLLAQKLNVPYDQWIFAQQQHTHHVQEVGTSDCGKGTLDFASGIANVDGLYTKDKNIMLATFHADCVPLYFIAPNHGLIGVVHAGWQGTVKEIARHFVYKWKGIGVKVSDIHVVIGPSATQANYIVGEDVVTQVLEMDTEFAREALIDLGAGRYKLDTSYLNYLTLIELGVPEEQMVISSYCTIADHDLFYSYRKEGQTGRMLASITQI